HDGSVADRGSVENRSHATARLRMRMSGPRRLTMSHKRNYGVLFLWLAGFLFALPGAAQQPITVAKVDVPFDYWIGRRKFPAGEYILDSSVPTFLTIRSKNGAINEQIPTILNGDPVDKKDARLRFVRRDGKFYLNELWGVLGKRVVTSEYGKSSQQNAAREV